MTGRAAAPYGSWKSPLSSALIASGTIGLGQIAAEGDDLYWLESRPSENGRSLIVRCSAENGISDITPPPFNVRTRVHEYGGGAFLVHQGTLYFSNFSDQRLYAQEPGRLPVPITPQGSFRYADGVFDAARHRIICVREDHSGSGVVNSLAGLDAGGSQQVATLVSGADFYSSPRLSPGGGGLAWLSWDHPDMPWDSSRLYRGRIGPDGSIDDIRHIAGGPGESICQPEFSPGGDLYFVSDRSGWWNLYRWREGKAEAVYPLEAEFAVPHWVFGQSRYAFLSSRHILCSWIERGISFLGVLDLESGRMERIESPCTWIDSLCVSGGKALMTAASPLRGSAVIRLDPATGKEEVLKESARVALDPACISLPRSIEFPTQEGTALAYAFYYPPASRDFRGLPGELPPLLVFSHGGPTGAAADVLNLTIQFFTSRGFAVANVNYGGSSGFGRDYRRRLNGQWGVVDVEDCLSSARYLVEQGLADPGRLAIRGGSAGGFTTLCALTFHNLFKVGASYYGVSDIEALARDTHKFESHYLDSLVGPYPQRRDLYLERSPLYSAGRLSCPVIFFQGAEDRVVPPDQSERMAAALRRRGLPVAYLLFEHEQHGFRLADSLRRSLEAELYFYSRILGFTPADAIQPVKIDNLE